MPLHSLTSTQAATPVRDGLAEPSALHVECGAGVRVVQTSLRDGIELLWWRGEAMLPQSTKIAEGSNRIHFTHSTSGCFASLSEGGMARRQHIVEAHSARIEFNPRRSLRLRQQGPFESLTVMIRPDLFAEWAAELGEPIRRALAVGDCFVHAPCGAELRSTARTLGRAMAAAHMCTDGGGSRSPLWLFGQSMAMMGLVLEAQDRDGRRHGEVSFNDRQRLLRARDRLLADLSVAPTIAELAQEAGLSVLKIKRGFRRLFDNSVYGLFQQERMHEARRRLCGGDAAVMAVASELGYTNASHFAVAFHKQFGVNPSALKRRA